MRRAALTLMPRPGRILNRDLLSQTAPSEAVDPATRRTGRTIWARLIIGGLCKVILLVLVSLAAWAALPAALGWKPTTVSSGSMLPRLWIGDIAVSRPVTEAPRLEQVLLFDDPDHPGKLRLHRFVRVDDNGRMVMRGDANQTEDSTPITMEAVRGVAVLRIPFIGLPIVWLREGRYVPLGLTLVGLALLLAGARITPTARGGPEADGTSDADSNAGGPARPDVKPRRDPRARPKARRPWRRRAGTAAASLTASAVLVGGSSLVIQPAWAKFTSRTSNPASSYSAAPFYTCRAAALAESPYLFYALDEISGSSAADSSGNGNHGTYEGTVSRGVAQACPRDSGTAVTLNGSSGYISTPNRVNSPDVFSVQAWFRTTTGSGGRIIGFGKSRTGNSINPNDRHVYMTNAGTLIFGVEPSSVQTVSSTASYNDGAWHQVTATLSGAGMRLYVDGILVASNPAVTSGARGNGYWRVGFDTLNGWPSAPSSSYFSGTLDNVAIYTTALSASSIADGYEAST